MAVSKSSQRRRNRKPRRQVPLAPPKPVVLGRDDFLVYLLRPKQPARPLTSLVTSLSWSDSAPVLTGDLQVQDPSSGKPTVDILAGDQIQLQGRSLSAGVWNEVWRMRVQGTTTSLKAGTRAWTLADDLQNLADSVDDFRFARKKGHRRGWLASEVIRYVCRRYGIKVGALPRTTYRIKNLTKKAASPLDVITDAMKTERVHTGRRYVMRFRRGKLFITPLVREALVYEMGPTIIDATFTTAKDPRFATDLTVLGSSSTHKGKDGKKHKVAKPHKITVRVTSPKSSRRFGVVHRSITLKGIDSRAEARSRGLHEITKSLKPVRTFTFTHPGILGVRRGQAMRLAFPERGLAQVVWITELRHSVSGGDYSMEVTVMFDDPFKLTKADRVARDKAAKAAKHGRKSKATKKRRPKPRLAAVRR